MREPYAKCQIGAHLPLNGRPCESHPGLRLSALQPLASPTTSNDQMLCPRESELVCVKITAQSSSPRPRGSYHHRIAILGEPFRNIFFFFIFVCNASYDLRLLFILFSSRLGAGSSVYCHPCTFPFPQVHVGSEPIFGFTSIRTRRPHAPTDFLHRASFRRGYWGVTESMSPLLNVR